MRNLEPKYKGYLFICTNVRDDGRESCGKRGSEEVFVQLKEQVKAAMLPIKVVRSGCLGHCEQGITVLSTLLGTFGEVTIEDVAKIIALHQL
ncbi:(2Fe-2S) ferredoxin domain-containing protein [Patescibacteria group bacterium]|nr:(2Fe-2S) ferredoxin domain-containing protein [Patescibacteria group bacterium]